MTAKEYLNQVRKIDCLIREKKEEIEAVNDLLNIHGVSYDKLPSDNHSTDTMQKLILRKIELERELQERMIDLLAQKREIMNTVDRLNKAEEIQVIYARYFRRRTWEEIGSEMGYTARNVQYIHGSALLNIEKILDGSGFHSFSH